MEQERLNKIERVLNKRVQAAPDGTLYVTGRKGKASQFYHVEKEKILKGLKPKCGTYISKDNLELVTALAQKDYDEKVLKWIKKTKPKINTILKCYEHDGPGLIYNKLSDARKELIDPIEAKPEKYIEMWKASKIVNSNGYAITTNIITENGEHVRSKSEKIIADKLNYMSIPYVYEPLLTLSDGYRLFPDFCLLNIKDRKEYYLEHFGMMDNPDYCKRAIEKISLYEKNGIILGKQLLCSFETSDTSVDLIAFENVLREFLL